MTMTLVETLTVGAGGAATLTFTNIPQSGTDLLLLFSIRDSQAAVYENISININGSTSSRRTLRGDDGGTSSTSSTSNFPFGFTPGANATANTFGNHQFYISNYTLSGVAKAFSVETTSENNGSVFRIAITAGTTTTTNPITSLSIAAWNQLVQYSTASLYTITKA